MGPELRNGDIIARHIGDGQFRLARFVNGADLPLAKEAALDRGEAEARARTIAAAIQSCAWMEALDGTLRCLD